MKAWKWNYNKICKFVEKVYDEYNGVVNPLLISDRLIIDEPSKVKIKKDFDDTNIPGRLSGTFAMVLSNCVHFNPNMLLDMNAACLELYGGYISDMGVRGILISTIIHELSHLNQKIDYFKVQRDDLEMLKMEVQNELNVSKFIRRHSEEIVNKFGSFGTEAFSSAYIKRALNMGIDINALPPYKPIKSAHEKFYDMMDFCSGIDTKWLLQDAYSRGYKYFELYIANKKNFDVWSLEINRFAKDIHPLYTIFEILHDKIYRHKTFIVAAFARPERKTIQIAFEQGQLTNWRCYTRYALVQHPQLEYIKKFIIDPEEEYLDDLYWIPATEPEPV